MSATPVKSGIPTTKSTTASTRRFSFPSILTWQNPVKSGTVFIELLAILVVWRFGNIFRTALRLSYWAIGITGSVEYASRLLKGSGPGFVSSYKPSRYIDINQVSVEKYTNKAVKAAVDAFSELKKLLDAEDLGLSATVFFFTLFLYFLTGVLSISTIAFVLVILGFTLPPVYLKFHKEIDQVVATASNHANDYYQQASTQVNKQIGPHLDVAKKHLNTATSFVGLKNPYRGGYPSDPATSAKTTSADVPPVGIAKKAEPVVAKSPKLSANASSNTSGLGTSSGISTGLGTTSTTSTTSHLGTTTSTGTTGTNPFTSKAEILAAAKEAVPEIAEVKSVPTLAGNVNLTDELQDSLAKDKQQFDFTQS